MEVAPGLEAPMSDRGGRDREIERHRDQETKIT